MPNAPIISVKNVVKRFPGVLALNGVSMDVYPGKVHVLIGENGAGKSTLFKIIAGIYPPDEGTLFYKGKQVNFNTPSDAIHSGIAMIHQELSAVPDLSVSENIFLGREHSRKRFPLDKYFLDKKSMHKETKELLTSLKMDIDPKLPLNRLKTAQMQMVEIAKAVSQNASVIIMDEPTSSISDNEVEVLFDIINRLKAAGVAIIYVSHRLKELYQIGDTVTVLRDGQLVTTAPISETDENKLVSLMVGREIEQNTSFISHASQETVLEVNNLSREGEFQNVSFSMRKGEVFGLAGLVGAGRTEVVRTIFGADKPESGTISIFGKEAQLNSPREAIKLGVGLVPEDRRLQGILVEDSVNRNISLPALQDHATAGFMSFKWEKETAKTYIEKIRIKTANMLVRAKNLSGGNQQKVILAKWMAANSKLLIMDEPTRGIDVGAKAEIYHLISEFCSQGGSVLVVSSELIELLRICDRIGVMRQGELSGILNRSEATEESIIKLASLGNCQSKEPSTI